MQYTFLVTAEENWQRQNIGAIKGSFCQDVEFIQHFKTFSAKVQTRILGHLPTKVAAEKGGVVLQSIYSVQLLRDVPGEQAASKTCSFFKKPVMKI